MIIDKVEMDNFGPYRDKNDLNLGLGDHPLVVIHGQNMAGKTTIINAVRWGLYGIAKDRLGRPQPTRALINDDAFEGGDRRVAVSLTLRVPEDDDAIYVLKRQHQIKQGLTGDLDNHYEKVLEISRNGHVYNSAAFDEAVSSLLPEGISRFFLFDGELLNEYEDLVREGGQSEARAVKQAIEMILGLPAARQGRDDIATLKGEVSRRVQKASKEDLRAQEAGQVLQKLDEEKTRLSDEKANLEALLRKAKLDIRDLDENLKNFEESRADAGRREELLKQKDELQRRQTEALQARRDLARDVWRDVLAPRLELETIRLTEEQLKRASGAAELQTAQTQLRKLQTSVSNGVCEQCGQALPDPELAKARAEIDSLSKTVGELEAQSDLARMNEVTRIIGQLRQVAPAGKVDAIRMAEGNLGKLRIELHKVKGQLEQVDERLTNIDTDQMHEYDTKRRQLLTHRDNLISELDRVTNRLAEIKIETDRQNDIVLQNQNPVFARLKQEMMTLEQLEDIYKRAVDDLADDLRQDVEAKASEIFRELTTDASYSGLRINENYGLTILREDGSPALQRSAGAEQVVALSLLGALNKLATKRGPVIMDTPFGRLDRDHRANILRYLPSMAEQVVLLVHDGEIDPDVDLAEIRSQIDGEYRISHPNAHSSQILAETIDRV